MALSLFELFAKISLDSSDYERGLSSASSLTKTFGDNAKAALGALGKAAAVGLTAASAGVVAFSKSAVDAGSQFDSSMAQVAATMGKTVGEIGNLRDFAMDMGAKTAFSATQAAEALNYMALAGYSAETSMQVLPTVLNLAAAGGMALGDASDMITDSLSALGLESDYASTLVDQMASASSHANASVSQMGAAILTVGGTAKVLGGGMMTLADGTKQAYSSTTELNQVLGLLADNGIKSSEGGTALRNIILSLTAPTDKAAKTLKNLGVSALDSSGNMRSMKDIFADLNKAMSGMSEGKKTEILNEIFNKVDLKSVNALMGTNVKRWDELAASIENSKYAAEKMADTQLDNLAGDVTLFQSALEGAQIVLSDALMPSLRNFVQFGTEGITRVTDAFKGANVAQSLAESFRDAEGAMLPIEENAQKLRDQFSAFRELAPLFSFRDEAGELGELNELADGFYQTISQLSYDAQTDIATALGLDNVDALYEVLDENSGLTWKLEKLFATADAAMEKDRDLAKALLNTDDMAEVNALLDETGAHYAELQARFESLDASAMTDGFSAAMEALPGVINDGIAILMGGVPKVFEVGGQILGAVVDGIVTNLPVLGDGAAQVAVTFADYLRGEIETALDSIGILEPVTEAFSGVGEAFDRIGDSVSPLIEKFKEWTASEEAAQGAAGLLEISLTLLGVALSAAAGFFSDIVDVGARLATTITENIALFAGLAGAAGAFMAAMEINTLIGFATQMGGLTGLLGSMHSAVSTATIGLRGLFAVLAANPIIAVVTVIGFLVTAFITAYNTSEDFRNKVNGALQAVKNFIDTFVAAVDNFFTVTIPNAFGATIAKAKEVKDTIVNKFGEAVDFLSSLPGKAYQWGKDLMDNFKQAILDNPIAKAISGVADTVSSYLHHSTPDVGPLKDDDTWMPDMMRMFADGIQKNASLVENAAGNVADSLQGAIAPTTNWAVRVGEEVTVGLANGIEKKASEAEQAAEKAASNIYNGLSKWADKTAKYERLSLREQLDMWKAILSQFDRGTEQWANAYDKVWDLEEKIADEQAKAAEQAAKETEQAVKDSYSALTKWLDKAAKYTDASYATQMQTWRQALEAFERNSEQYAEIEEKLFDLRLSAYKEYADKVEEISGNIDELRNSYDDEVAKRTADIAKSYKLFDEIPKKQEVSGKRLLENLQGQIESIRSFYDNLAKLQERGMSAAVVDEIRSMGVGASDELEALLSLSDKKLAQYAGLYEEKQSLANSIAISELDKLKGETELKVQEQMDALQALYEETAPALGESFAENLAQGIRNGLSGVTEAATEAAEAALAKTREILGIGAPLNAAPTRFSGGVSAYAPAVAASGANAGGGANAGLRYSPIALTVNTNVGGALVAQLQYDYENAARPF